MLNNSGGNLGTSRFKMRKSKLLRQSSHGRYSKRKTNSELDNFSLDIELKKLNLEKEF
jgi:hypothetical protein